MNNHTLKKILSLLTVASMLFFNIYANELEMVDDNITNIPVAEVVEEANTVNDIEEDAVQTELLYTEQETLSHGLTYTRNIYNHSDYGNQREYILTYTPSAETSLSFSSNEQLYSTNTLKNIALYNHPDENIVAGINGDFFNMSTGVPESAYIKDYELYTTDRDSFCLAYTDEGEYFFDKPQIKLSLKAENGTVINIAHLNKEFSEYALYMYNRRYSNTTHITNSYSQAVLLPYEDYYSTEEIIKIIEDDELKDRYYSTITQNSDNNNALDDIYKKIEEISGYTKIGDNFYMILGVMPNIGYTEKLVVFRIDNDCINSEIPANSYVLCGDNRSYGYIPSSMKIGDTFEFQITGNERYYNVKNAIGVGDIIVNNGEVIDNTQFSHYTSLQPRSAVGIKADGSLIFYAADGRQKNISSGIKLIDLANAMLDLGCVYAANLDGGGSTIVTASRPGIDQIETVNSPSGITERKISNGFVFTNKLQRDGTAYSAHIYTDSILTFNDWFVEIPEYILSDKNGFSVAIDNQSDENNVSFFVNNGVSSVLDGFVYPNNYLGFINVCSNVNGNVSDTAFNIHSIENPDKITLTSDKALYAPYELPVLEVSATYKNLDILCGFNSFDWLINNGEDNITSISDDGVFTSYEYGKEYTVSASRGLVSAGVTFYIDDYPFSDIKDHWAVKEVYTLARSQVIKGFPTDEENVFIFLPENKFTRYEFCVMLDRMTDLGDDIVIPEIHKPEDSGDDVDISNPHTNFNVDNGSVIYESITPEIAELFNSSFDNLDEHANRDNNDDVGEIANTFLLADLHEIPDWAYESVFKLYASGILKDIMQYDNDGNEILNGADYITRYDVMSIIGKLCKAAPEDYEIDTYNDLTYDMVNDSVKNCLYSGIFSGYDDMTIRPDGLLTRAEAATVLVRLDNSLS